LSLPLSNSKFSHAIQNLPYGNIKNRYAVVEALAAVPVGGCFGFHGNLSSHAACFAGRTAFPSMPDAAPQPLAWKEISFMGTKASTPRVFCY
jgi:hypothetical protein